MISIEDLETIIYGEYCVPLLRTCACLDLIRGEYDACLLDGARRCIKCVMNNRNDFEKLVK